MDTSNACTRRTITFSFGILTTVHQLQRLVYRGRTKLEVACYGLVSGTVHIKPRKEFNMKIKAIQIIVGLLQIVNYED